MYLHIKLAGTASAFRWMPIYNAIWELSCGLFFRPSRLNLFLLQGNCLAAMRRTKRLGKLVIGEAVNLHPRALERVLDRDAEQTEVPRKRSTLVLARKVKELDYVDFILTPSKSVAESYIEEGFDSSRILVLPYGVGGFQECGPEIGTASGPIRVLVLGQIAARKGQWHLLKAIAAHAAPSEFEIHLVGAENAAYLDALRRLGVGFTHVRHVPHAQIGDLLKSSSVLCLNSIEDGFGMVVTEAMACNVPVAVSKFAGASEVVGNIGGGLVYDPYDYLQTVTALRKCARGDYPPRKAPPASWEEYSSALIASLDALLERCK